MKDTDKVIHLNERQNRIMEIMRQQNAVSVATLSSLMKVSEVTIRKAVRTYEQRTTIRYQVPEISAFYPDCW